MAHSATSHTAFILMLCIFVELLSILFRVKWKITRKTVEFKFCLAVDVCLLFCFFSCLSHTHTFLEMLKRTINFHPNIFMYSSMQRRSDKKNYIYFKWKEKETKILRTHLAVNNRKFTRNIGSLAAQLHGCHMLLCKVQTSC